MQGCHRQVKPFVASPPRRIPGKVLCAGKGFGKPPPVKKEKPKQEARPYIQNQNANQSSTQDENDFSSDPRQRVLEVPEAVNQRLLNRMLIFSLGPVFLGFLALPLLAYMQVGLHVDLPQGTAFAVSGLFFGAGLLGITYGIFSASWDENVKGSGLGLSEFKSNASPLLEKFKPK